MAFSHFGWFLFEAPSCFTKKENTRNSGATYVTGIITQPNCELQCSLVTCVAYEWQKVKSECWIYTSFDPAGFVSVTTNDFYEKTCTTSTTTATTTGSSSPTGRLRAHTIPLREITSPAMGVRLGTNCVMGPYMAAM